MNTVFQVDGLTGWSEFYDESNAESVTAVLRLETPSLRHRITVAGLSEARWLNEVFKGCPEIRVKFDKNTRPPYQLEVVGADDLAISFTATAFELETRDHYTAFPEHPLGNQA